MSPTGGTVPIMRTLDPDLVEEMGRELARLTAVYRRTESKIDRAKRDVAIAAWRRRLGDGSLSEIARRAGISRVQAGRIWAAQQEAQATGQPARPTRHFYNTDEHHRSAAEIQA
jgi:DNA invertase Pin-like site-specific DNA recombinase